MALRFVSASTPRGLNVIPMFFGSSSIPIWTYDFSVYPNDPRLPKHPRQSLLQTLRCWDRWYPWRRKKWCQSPKMLPQVCWCNSYTQGTRMSTGRSFNAPHRSHWPWKTGVQEKRRRRITLLSPPWTCFNWVLRKTATGSQTYSVPRNCFHCCRKLM